VQINPEIKTNHRPRLEKGIMMQPKPTLFMIFIVLLLLAACASAPKEIAPAGEPVTAPDFALPDQNGQTVRLSEVLESHKGAVIAFYPKDDTRN